MTDFSAFFDDKLSRIRQSISASLDRGGQKLANRSQPFLDQNLQILRACRGVVDSQRFFPIVDIMFRCRDMFGQISKSVPKSGFARAPGVNSRGISDQILQIAVISPRLVEISSVNASRAPAASHSEGSDRPSQGTSHGHQNGGFDASSHYLRWLEYESISF